jgi:glycosyltransferase involved in cell wall biosynthesis
MRPPQYVLITPARNEEAYLALTIESVIAQTVLPRKWVIVSDGSTDRTDEIVESYTKRFDWIELVRAHEKRQASFGSKVKAIEAGCERLVGIEYDFIGNLDADVSFEPNYFEKLFEEFEKDPKLGLAGGDILENIGGKFLSRSVSLNHVAGAVQMFRRRCYEGIGGYIPIKGGGIDAAAGVMSRMKGWRTQTFMDLHVLHHRRVLTGGGNILATRFNKGRMNYLLGYHPLFHLAVCLRRTVSRPYVVGSICLLAGYCYGALKRLPKPVSEEFVRYLRSEQLGRLRLGRGAANSGRNS